MLVAGYWNAAKGRDAGAVAQGEDLPWIFLGLDGEGEEVRGVISSVMWSESILVLSWRRVSVLNRSIRTSGESQGSASTSVFWALALPQI